MQQMAVALVVKQEPDIPFTTMKEFYDFFKIEMMPQIIIIEVRPF